MLIFFLCGDVLISKRLPFPLYDGGDEVSNLLKSHDLCLGNLETTIRRKEGYPEAFPGGGYAMAAPECLKDLKKIGFNMFNTANNHAMDYGHGGLLATIKYLTEEEILHAGTGENLSEASSAVFFEHATGRIAMLGITSAFHDSYAAAPQNQDMQGRPGVAPLKHKEIYYLTKENYNKLLHIAQVTGINNYINQGIKEGYQLTNKNLKIGPYEFAQSNTEENYLETFPNEADLERTIKIVQDAKMRAEVVIVCIHSHQFRGNSKTLVPDFIRTFAHQCINYGADIIVCHGPHVLRGIELYKKGVIFHGLGNFIFQHEAVNILPEEFYQKYGTTRQNSIGVAEVFNIRSQGGKVGLNSQLEPWDTIIASLNITDSKMNIALYPIEISKGYSGGFPKLVKDSRILEKVRELSKEFGTDFNFESELNRLIINIDR